MASLSDTMPELLMVTEDNAALARRARRLAAQGALKRLFPGIYTSNVDSPPESIVLRHWQAIIGHLLPGGVISHRSACRAQRWSAAFDYSLPRAQLRESLARCNAFQEDLRSYKLLFPPVRPPS